MTNLDRPQPAPVTDSLAALIGNLDHLRESEAMGASFAEAFWVAALDNMREIAAACGIDWQDVLAEHDRLTAAEEARHEAEKSGR